jgi:hypothetical protein
MARDCPDGGGYGGGGGFGGGRGYGGGGYGGGGGGGGNCYRVRAPGAGQRALGGCRTADV